MNEVFVNRLDKFANAYLNDILVYSIILKDYYGYLKIVLQRLKKKKTLRRAIQMQIFCQ